MRITFDLSNLLAVEPTDNKIVIMHDPEPVSSFPDSYLVPEALLNGILPPPSTICRVDASQEVSTSIFSTHTHTFYPQANRISRPPQPTFHYPNSRGHVPVMNSLVMQTSELHSLIFFKSKYFISTSFSFCDTLVQ